ncbi:MAG: hypothetical protein P4K86_02915 [Terracidiphilus sp.]|nr:hypothetical protein [Terracidiphilus sp.]
MIKHAPQSIPLLDAIRTVSHSAHAWRDRASKHYNDQRFNLSTKAKSRKEYLYTLKERGIAAAHQLGLLRYIGQSPQAMGVYEYGDGGTSSFHSCLHPVGVVRDAVKGHPEVLLVAAKALKHRICDAENTIQQLPAPGAEYERSFPPRIPRSMPTCYECGMEGHIARYCPERDFDW